jgi:hypothetical protein
LNEHDQEKELIAMWQQSNVLPPADTAELTRSLGARVKSFDRRIFWRNFREYAAGAVLIAFFIWMSFRPVMRLLSFGGIAAVGFVMFYLWRRHRELKPLDPSSDARSYREALLARYDHQIRLLRQVRYWYVLPLYLWMLGATAMTSSGRSAIGVAVSLFVTTAFSAFVVWLNEGYGVRKLKEERAKVETLLQEEQ